MNLQSRPTERSQLCLCRAGNAVLVRLPFGVPAFLDAFCGGLCVFLYVMACRGAFFEVRRVGCGLGRGRWRHCDWCLVIQHFAWPFVFQLSWGEVLRSFASCLTP